MSSSDVRVAVPPAETSGLTFRDLGFSATPSLLQRLQQRNAKAPEPRRILDGVSGVARPGELLFILGASGSGKTSALDALAGRVATHVSGVVSLAGAQATSTLLKRSLKYVPQTPTLYETLSVEETLNYAAAFTVADASERADRVDAAITALGLDAARHTKCGGVFYRGLSGGQRRRVAIALELVARPAVLLLDEPTTGLDSTSAHAVMAHLRALASREGIAVVCTVHQPTRRILDMSDRLLVLADGRVAYSGRTDGVVAHFAALGLELPPRTNVADWLVDQTSSDFHDDPRHVGRLLDKWPGSAAARALYDELDSAGGTGTGTGGSSAADNDTEIEKVVPPPRPAADTGRVYKRSVAAQTLLLARRNVVEAFRNPAVIYLRLVMYVALAAVIGLGWWQVPERADNSRDRVQALGFSVSFFVFMSIAVLPVYLNEKQIVVRERANANYSAFAYIAGHFVMEVLFIFGMTLVLAAVVYFMVGLKASASAFFFYFLVLAVALLCAESLMLTIAAVVPFLLGGIAVGAFLFGAFMVVMGGLVNISRIPWVVRWLQYVSIHTFALAAVAWNDIGDVTFAPAPDAIPPVLEPVSGEELLRSVGWPLNDKWANVAVVAAMTMVYRAMALAWVHYKWTGKR